MVVSSQTNAHTAESTFGFTQAFLLGTLLLLGGLISVPCYTIKVGGQPLAVWVGSLLAAYQLVWVNGALWVLEVAGYLCIAWFFSRRRLAITAIGIASGLIIRLLVCLLIAFLLSANSGSPASFIFMEMNRGLWLLRLLAVIVTAIILLVPCRELLANGFYMLGAKTGAKADGDSKHFSFKSARETAPITLSSRPLANSAKDPEQLAPPEGFTPITPREGITGLINIPVEVIGESVPEALAFLNAEFPVRVRLAYIVPQMSHATAWLTWQQIFMAGQNDPNYIHAERPDTNFQGRWVRLPARCYVSQVPREHFVSPPHTPPAWMQRPPVPQEQQFER